MTPGIARIRRFQYHPIIAPNRPTYHKSSVGIGEVNAVQVVAGYSLSTPASATIGSFQHSSVKIRGVPYLRTGKIETINHLAGVGRNIGPGSATIHGFED